MLRLILALPFLAPAGPAPLPAQAAPPPPEAFLAVLDAALTRLSGASTPVEVQRQVLPVDLEHHADADGVFAYPLPDPVLKELGRRSVAACDPCTVEGSGPSWTRVTVYSTDTPSRGLWELYVRAFQRIPSPGSLVRYSEAETTKYWIECEEGGGCRVLRSETVSL